jgi:putative FmdB family regulatory protein
MPFYEYHCRTCGARVTIRQSFADDSRPTCTACPGGAMARVISGVSVVKSRVDRTRDLAWIDRDLAGRIKKKVTGPLSPGLQEAVDRWEGS